MSSIWSASSSTRKVRFVQTHRAAVHQVQQTTRRRDQQVDAALQPLDLCVDRLAAHDHRHLERRAFGKTRAGSRRSGWPVRASGPGPGRAPSSGSGGLPSPASGPPAAHQRPPSCRCRSAPGPSRRARSAHAGSPVSGSVSGLSDPSSFRRCHQFGWQVHHFKIAHIHLFPAHAHSAARHHSAAPHKCGCLGGTQNQIAGRRPNATTLSVALGPTRDFGNIGGPCLLRSVARIGSRA